jgi:hypothetical protein
LVWCLGVMEFLTGDPPPPRQPTSAGCRAALSLVPALPSRSVKIAWNSDLRRVRIDGDATVEGLRELIGATFPELPLPPSALRLTYTDADGDIVSVHSDAEVCAMCM